MLFFYTESFFFILCARWLLYRKEWGLENRRWPFRRKWKRFKAFVALCYRQLLRNFRNTIHVLDIPKLFPCSKHCKYANHYDL